MQDELTRVLDECLELLRRGETIESCLRRYPSQRKQLEPLLQMAQSVALAPKVSPSGEFQKASKARLLLRLKAEKKQKQTDGSVEMPNALAEIWQWLRGGVTVFWKIAIPVALILLLLAGSFLLMPKTSNSTIAVLSGGVEITKDNIIRTVKGTSGLDMNAGMRVATGSDTKALITFFDGSTLALEPDTDIEIERFTITEGSHLAIVMNQWSGRTWNHVVPMTGPDSVYEVQTPSLHAAVIGTSFMVDVSKTGATMVRVSDGTVAVHAQQKEVSVPAGYEINVEPGYAPKLPETYLREPRRNVTSPGPRSSVAAAELSAVQRAMDMMMIDQAVSEVTATPGTNKMTDFPLAPRALYPNYLRGPKTVGTYSCNSNGEVIQVSYP